MIMTVSVVKYSHYRHGDNISSNRKYTLQFIDMKIFKQTQDLNTHYAMHCQSNVIPTFLEYKVLLWQAKSWSFSVKSVIVMTWYCHVKTMS